MFTYLPLTSFDKVLRCPYFLSQQDLTEGQSFSDLFVACQPLLVAD